MKRIWILVLAVLLLCGCTPTTPGSSDPQASQPTETVDHSAPDFTLYDKDGKAYKLSDFEGKPVVLNFWASWCPPCKLEMPDLEAAYQDHGSEVQFLMVNLTDGSQETVETASAYIAQQGYTFPVYYDLDYAGSTAYAVTSIPITFFIDAKGDLVAYHSGIITPDILRQGIDMITE